MSRGQLMTAANLCRVAVQNSPPYANNITCIYTHVHISCQRVSVTASRLNLAHLGHKKLIYDCFECSFMDFFLLKYLLTQAQVIKAFY